MVVEGESPEVSVSKKSRIAPLTTSGKWVNLLMQTATTAMPENATLPSGEVFGNLSGELLDPRLAHEGRKKERENLRNVGVYARVPKHQAVGKRVGVQWLDDDKQDVDGSVSVRSRLKAMLITWETRIASRELLQCVCKTIV